MAIRFMNMAGNPVWIDERSVLAVDTIYSDGSAQGEDVSARPITRVHLAGGALVDLDAKAESVADNIWPDWTSPVS